MENRQLAAIMFTDIIGYTSLMTADEKRTINIVDKSISIVKPLVKQYQGKVIKEIGDGTLSSFPSVVNAVKCAVEIQTKVRNISSFKLRIGIHLGDVVWREQDVFGTGVNVASRLESIALPGTIIISGQVNDQLEGIPGINPVYIGKKKLKHVQSAVNIYKISLDSDAEAILSEEDYIIEDVDEDRKKSMVVLPFKDLTSDKEMESISRNLCEGIIGDLSSLNDLKVIPSSSSNVLLESIKNIKQLYEDYNIDYLLDGTIKKSNGVIRISTQLIEGANDKLLWSAKYKGVIKELDEFQKEISSSIVMELKLSSVVKSSKGKSNLEIESQTVLEYCFKARILSSSYQKDDFESAIQILQEGIEIYGDDISLYTVLGITYFKYFHSGNSRDIGLIGKTEEYLEMVRKIDSESAQAFVLQGMLAYYKGDLLEAGINLRRSNDLLVSDPSSMFYLCLLYRNTGEIKQARSLATRLSEIDPLTASSQILPAIVYYFDGKFQKAFESAKSVLPGFKEHPIVLFYIGIIANAVHKRKEAIGYFETNFQVNETNIFAGLGLIYKNAILGQKELVLLGLEKYLPFIDTGIAELSLWIAHIYSMVSEKEKTIEYLKKAVKKGFINISYLKNIDPYLSEIRKEALFASVLEEIHKKSESI